jgi:cytochrome d ubiquinol oxidase subunit II
MNLHNLWFAIDAVFWIGFFILEGFDFGVGILHSFLGKTEGERRVAVNSIGPFWDGNEVWLIVAGAVIFAAFPAWYATMFSTFYLALVLVLAALFARGVSFEYQRKFDDPRWRATWRWSLTIGSALIPLLVGVALGDLLHGLPINAKQLYTGNFFGLLVPYGLWTGITLLSLCLLSGATYLRMKTLGELHDRAAAVSKPLAAVAVITLFGFLTWTHVGLYKGFVPNPIEAFAMLAVLAAGWLVTTQAEGWAFAASCMAIGGTVASIFAELYPNVMVSTTSSAYNLTVAGTASGSYALKVMTVVAVIFTPVVLLYQGWNYHVFRGRLAAPAVGAKLPPGEAGAAGAGPSSEATGPAGEPAPAGGQP